MQIISPLQKKILQVFPQAPDSEQFYLTGGTALALFYLHHRRSEDLDFFTSMKELVDPFSRNLEEVLKKKGMHVTRQRTAHTFIELEVKLREAVTIIQLAQDAAFRFSPPKEFPEFPGVKVDNLTDIASNKLLALYGRASLRDFIDVYVLVKKSGIEQKTLMQQAKKKDPGFDPYWLGIAFERISTCPPNAPEMLMLIEPIPLNSLQSFFNQWRKEIASQLKT